MKFDNAFDLAKVRVEAAAKVAFYKAINWEDNHPDKRSNYRQQAEYKLYQEFIDIFTAFEYSLQQENKILHDLLVEYKNCNVTPIIFPIEKKAE